MHQKCFILQTFSNLLLLLLGISLNGKDVSRNETFGIKIRTACNGNVHIDVMNINLSELEEDVS